MTSYNLDPVIVMYVALGFFIASGVVLLALTVTGVRTRWQYTVRLFTVAVWASAFLAGMAALGVMWQ